MEFSLSQPLDIVPGHPSKSTHHRPADHYRSASPVLTAGTYCSLPRSPRRYSRWTTGSIFHAQLHAGSVRVELTGQNLSHTRYLPILEFQLIFRSGTRAVSVVLDTGKQCLWLSICHKLLVEGNAPKPPLNTEFHSVAARLRTLFVCTLCPVSGHRGA